MNCRSTPFSSTDVSEISNLLTEYDQTDISLFCPSSPGYGSSDSYDEKVNKEQAIALFTSDIYSVVKNLGFDNFFSVGIGIGSEQASFFSARYQSSEDIKLVGITLVSPLLVSAPLEYFDSFVWRFLSFITSKRERDEFIEREKTLTAYQDLVTNCNIPKVLFSVIDEKDNNFYFSSKYSIDLFERDIFIGKNDTDYKLLKVLKKTFDVSILNKDYDKKIEGVGGEKKNIAVMMNGNSEDVNNGEQ